jgi:putative addiction module component (TIGR02574 family)
VVFERNADFAERASVSPHSKGWWQYKLTGILGGATLCGMTELAPELARLSPRERLALIESLWESLDEKDVPVTDAQRAELDRRIVGLDQDGAESIPWDQLRAELRQRR